MESLFRPLVREPVRHLYRLITNRRYRTLCRLVTFYGRTPRFRTRTLRVDGWEIESPDVASLISAYKEIFLQEIYSFPHEGDAPFILDCGANIGLSILFFKERYPKSNILAFEADPKIFSVLKRNLERNAIKGVEIVQKAVWISEESISFSPDGADGGRLETSGAADAIRVPTLRLAEILRAYPAIDLLKLDVEGAEGELIADCQTELKRIRFAFVEFHSFPKKSFQGLGSLIDHFEKNGFRVHIHQILPWSRPFFGAQMQATMDLQLNCFFTRNDVHETR